ncbi:uncharacterized protein TNIN_293481 [Trichonephila inaurata madagascariensis]|uniref:Ig-like domain-containing protein n=1 Tax=Trichonephila inaurata madagascariensis TaxID=2747483 RepID=A0A8X6YX39_9ARAC|nr:uncharacterized protein TNIN_293481 [Trichonephila inaurata madagascariensis]
MFFELICLFFAFLDIIICAPSSHSILSFDEQSTEMSSNGHDSANVLLQNEIFLRQLSDDSSIVTKNIFNHRTKRGIVLIDEDFDVPPEPGIKQSWSNGESDKNVTKSGAKMMILLGEENQTESNEEISSINSDNVTPEQLQLSTNRSTSSRAVSSTSQNTTPEQLMLTTNRSKEFQSTDKYTTNEQLQQSTDKNWATSSKEFSEIEGSGDVTELIISVVTEEPTETVEKSIIKMCLKLTCDSQDLIISPGISRMVPVGTNLTLTCTVMNASEQDTLMLYKHNENETSLLQESSKEQKLNFDIPLSQQHHSGMYMCLKLSEQSCCHQQLDISVYEVPNYKYHLIIIGLVAAVSLFACILLGICRHIKVKKYEVQLELQNLEKPILT